MSFPFQEMSNSIGLALISLVLLTRPMRNRRYATRRDVPHDLAVVVGDSRGTGASFCVWPTIVRAPNAGLQ